MRVAVLTDYPVVAFANGPSLATQSLKRHLELRGHEVTIVGPKPGRDVPDVEPGSVLLDSVKFAGHPGVQLPFAWPPRAFKNEQMFDVIHSHAASLLMHWGPMMRAKHDIPCLSTNTVYIPGFAQYTLPQQLYKFGFVRDFWANVPTKAVEASFAKAYSGGDGLIVQCAGLAKYWEDYGLSVPIHVIPRPIDTAIFGVPLGPDPYRSTFSREKRIVSVSRHAREKDIDKLIVAFKQYVLPRHPEASLTLVGDGQEHGELVALAEELGISDRVDFPGEKAHHETRDYYGHASVFAYASMTETYGQVVSEALWCGAPAVALDDKMGVTFQVQDGFDGVLVQPGADELERLGRTLNQLLAEPERIARMGANAARRARTRVAPQVIYRQYEDAYGSAREHLDRTRREGFMAKALPQWVQMMNRHVVPWTVQQCLLVALGSVRGRAKLDKYAIPTQRIDALPARTETVAQEFAA